MPSSIISNRRADRRAFQEFKSKELLHLSKLTWNFSERHQEEVEVGISREADRGERDAEEAEGCDEPGVAKVEETEEECSVFEEVQASLSHCGHRIGRPRVLHPGKK